MSKELKPCPFCGGKAIIKVNAQTLNVNACCKECNVIMKKNYKGSKRVEELLVQLITEDWNRRAETCTYDVNKIVEQLLSQSIMSGTIEEPFILLDKAVEIVREGVAK